MVSIDAAVAQAKAEIVQDMDEGTVPETVGTFGELHEWVDANTYGGLCDDNFSDQFFTHEAYIAFCAEVQERVGAWLGHRKENPAMRVTFTIHATLPADTTRDVIDQIAMAATVQVAEPEFIINGETLTTTAEHVRCDVTVA